MNVRLRLQWSTSNFFSDETWNFSSAKEQFRAQIRKDTLQDNKNNLYKKIDGPHVLRRESIDMKPFKKMQES